MAMEVGRACLEKCKSMGYEGAIYYGMVKEYADTRGWGVWEVFREFVQNALDETHELARRRPTFYPCKHVPDIRGVVIYDTGRGIATYNLYIGKSEKKPWQRGKFGEGLKIALLTAEANKIPVVIRSGDREFRPVFAPERVDDVSIDVFCICIKRLSEPMIGTQVYIYGVGNICDRFWNRVVQGVMERAPNAILLSHNVVVSYGFDVPITIHYDLIDKNITGGNAIVYVRDIYVSSFKEASGYEACFSYNLHDVQLDESRRIASVSSIEYDVQAFWRITIDKFEPEKVETDEHQRKMKQILKSMLRCVINDCRKGEMFESTFQLIPSWFVRGTPDRENKIRLLLDEVIGKDAVIIADRNLSKLADYFAIPHVFCPTTFGREAQNWFDLDTIFEDKIRKMEKEIVQRDRIDPKLRKRLEILEEIARIVFNPPPNVKVEYIMADPQLEGRVTDHVAYKIILINLYALATACEAGLYPCLTKFLSIYGHELAHIISHAGDLTPEHARALTDLLGRATSNAMIYARELRSLLSKLGRTYR